MQDFALFFEEDEIKFKQSITLTIFSLSCVRSYAGEETKAKLEIGSCKVLSREKAREKIKLHFTLHLKKSSTSHFIYRKDCQRVTKIFPENCPKKVFSSPKRQKSRARVIKPSNDTSLSIPQHETQIFFHARPLSKAQSEQADHIKYFSLHENIFSCL
jgi:hypothetical protein